MKLAIMQPYIFPFIGYFQLISAVDRFVFYDDVNYIKQGWINKNNLVVNGNRFPFSVPLEKQSSFNLICETKINQKFIDKWKVKFLRTIEESYKKSPHFQEVYLLISEVLNENHQYISELAISSVIAVCKYLHIESEIIPSSKIYNNANLSGKERVISICKKEEAKTYINAIGGLELYSKDYFLNEDIKLQFINPTITEYSQNNEEFIPGLSIIDLLMFNGTKTKELFLIDLDIK